MACNHESIRCTDNVFYCNICGAVLPNPYEDDKQHTPQEPAQEAPKKRKRKGAE